MSRSSLFDKDKGANLTGIVDWHDHTLYRGDRRYSLVPLRFELAWGIARGWTTVEPDALRRLDEALDTIEPATLQPGDAPARRVPGREERETMSLPKDVRTTKGRQNVLHYPPDIYRGNRGEISAWMRPNSTPPDLTLGGGEKCEFIATSSDTNGRFGLYRWTSGENETGPEAHFHRSISEQFYVLSGEIKLYDGSTWVTGRPGDYFYVPEGGIHAFKGGDFASMLLTFAPGGPREAYFEAMAAGGMSEDDDRQEFMIRHDNFFLGRS